MESIAATLTACSTSSRHLDQIQLSQIYAKFHDDGFAVLPGILTDRVPSLRAKIDELFADEKLYASNHRYDDIIMVRLFELDSEFQDLLVMEPFISIAEDLVGEQCHLIAQNVVRNPTGRAISNFHVDE